MIVLSAVALSEHGAKGFISNERVWGLSFANIGVGNHGQS